MATRSTIDSVIQSLQALQSETVSGSTVESTVTAPLLQPASGSIPAAQSSANGSTLAMDVWSEGGFVSFADGNFSFLPDCGYSWTPCA
jgi:hypothetical protein